MFVRLRSFLGVLRKRDRFEHDMREEMRFHVEARADDLERTGLSRVEAMRRARLEFGGLDSARDDCREARGVRWADEISGDLRYATRLMLKTPGFTAAAVLSLALGICGEPRFRVAAARRPPATRGEKPGCARRPNRADARSR